MIDVDHLDPYLLQPFGIVRSKLKRGVMPIMEM